MYDADKLYIYNHFKQVTHNSTRNKVFHYNIIYIINMNLSLI